MEREGARVRCERWGKLNDILTSNDLDTVIVEQWWAETRLFKDDAEKHPMVNAPERSLSCGNEFIEWYSPDKHGCSAEAFTDAPDAKGDE
jgi:hypothetical protein